MSKFLDRLAADRPLIYDGGFGSELFARGIELTNSTLANEAHPDAVVDIHKAYIAAGADLIGTNTFVASELHLEMAGKDPDQAGALTRTATDFYEGGIDFFSIETQFSATEAAMACQIARQTGLPIAINLTLKYTKDRKSGAVVYKTDWGHSTADLLDILAAGEYSEGDNLLDHVQVLGLNCGAETRRSEHTGMPYAISGVEQLKAAMADRGVAKKLMTYPNAGMPQLNSAHRTIYSQSPADMAQLVPDLAAAGAHIIGGCCGTTPDHIRAFRRAVDPN